MRKVKLKEVCDRITVGHVGPMADRYTPDGIPFLRSQNIAPFRLSIEDIKFVPREFHEKLRKSALHPGDVAVVRTGYPGTACVIPDTFEELNCADLVVITPSAELNPYFLAAIFNSAWGMASVAGKLVGVAQQHFNVGAAKELEVALPTRAVQDRIAGILSAYDELIENSQRRIKILEAMARALYREWFVHFRFPGHESVPRVPSPLGDIPQGWEVRKLGQVADTFRGRSYRSVDLADEGGLPFLNLKCLDRDGGFRRTGLKRYTGEFKDIHVARKGDIVMAVTDMTQERRIVARAALVPTLDNEFGIFSMDLVRIEPKPELPKTFLYSFLRHSSFADEVKQHANGANVLHLSPDRITDYRFVAPPSDLMHRFESFVAPVVEEIDTLANKTDNLRRTRDLLLPRLLSGQINVEAMQS
jgi:type I restriction enzyme S subunit